MLMVTFISGPIKWALTTFKRILDTKGYWTQKDTGHKRILDTKGYWTQKDTGHKRILDTKG